MRARTKAERLQQQALLIESFRSRGYRVVKYKNAPVIGLVKFDDENGKHYVAAIKGSAAKTDFWEGTRRREYVQKRLDDYAQAVAEWTESRKPKARPNASKFWAVGDVMSYSWGYDQTNVDWFEVVEVLKKSIRVRPIAANCDDHGGPTGGRTQPARGKFIGEPVLKHVGAEGYISFDHGCGSKWDGRSLYCSSYH